MDIPEDRQNNIVADGRKRLVKEESTQAEIAQAKARIRERYEAEMAKAGFLRRWILRYQMRKAIHEAIDRIAPAKGLYLRK